MGQHRNCTPDFSLKTLQNTKSFIWQKKPDTDINEPLRIEPQRTVFWLD